MNDRIKFSGHTMGTPDKDIYQVIDCFSRIGYDGIEVRVYHCKGEGDQASGQIDSETITDDEVLRIYEAARARGLEFSCLTSYYKNFVLPEDRAYTIGNLQRVIQIAALLHCPLIRVYGGQEAYELPGVWFNDVWTKTVSGIREVAEYAAQYGVRICIETHIGSLTMSVRDMVRLIEDVNMANVGMLFDYAWVELAGVEQGRAAVEAAARHIFHVHMKDWRLISRTPLKKTSCLMGEGTVRWPEVFDALKKVGYTGYISDEYEKFWYPEELPDAEIGMKHNLEYARALVLGE